MEVVKIEKKDNYAIVYVREKFRFGERIYYVRVEIDGKSDEEIKEEAIKLVSKNG